MNRAAAWRRLLASALAWLAFAGVAAAAPRIGVATMQPGEVFFERFGHDAIVVVDPASGRATSYNFGFFDPSEPDFVGNFARGRMMYYLVALPLEEDLQQYREAGRGVSIQWLDLPPRQADALADALAVHARPENARYRYDYYTSNCATQVRDALDRAMGGALKPQLEGAARGLTYRSESVRLASPAPWMWIGFDLGLGPYADRELSLWQESFIPMRLAENLRGVRNAEGRPLVQAEQPLLPQRQAAEPPAAPRRLWPWALAGLALAGLLAWLALRHPRLLGLSALLLWLPCALGGLLLAYLWGFTEHVAAWGNRNLLLLDPLFLLLWPLAWAWLRGRTPPRWTRWPAAAVAALALLAPALQLLDPHPQADLPWIALLLPVHLALAGAAWHRAGPRRPA